MKVFLISALLLISTCLLTAMMYPNGTNLYHVSVVLKNNQTLTGYVDVYPFYDSRNPPEYSTKSEKIGSDILPLIDKNYAGYGQMDSLWIATELISWQDMNFTVTYGNKQVNYKDIINIIALQDINYVSHYEGDGENGFWVNAHVNKEEALMIKKGVLFSLRADFTEIYTEELLLSCNPKFTQLDLYLYACLMSYHSDGFYNGINQVRNYTDGIGGAHPFLSELQIIKLSDKIQKYVHENDVSYLPEIISTIKNCNDSWLTMAKYLENSQTILPEAKPSAIDTLTALSNQGKVLISKLSAYQDSKVQLKTVTNKDVLYMSIMNCIFPKLMFPNKLRNDVWKTYLLKRGIVVVDMEYDA